MLNHIPSLPLYVCPRTARNSAAFEALEARREELRAQFPHWDDVQVNHVMTLERHFTQYQRR
jgi:hypothetical protein